MRQLVGAANIEGSPLFHVASGNLGYQVEHHLFPDMPSTRYAEIAPQVKEICERYGLPYNTGPFVQQLGMVQRTILRLAFPGGKPRPKPGPYKGGDGVAVSGSGNGHRPDPEPGRAARLGARAARRRRAGLGAEARLARRAQSPHVGTPRRRRHKLWR